MPKIKTKPRYRGHDRPFRPKNVSRHAFKRVYWPYIPVLLVIGVLSSLAIGQSAFHAALKNPTGQVLAYANSMTEAKLLADTNQQRNLAKVQPLRQNPQLDNAAIAKANDMASRNYWSHNTPDGQEPWMFVTAQNYDYQKLGENLAAGFDSEQSTVNGWMGSPKHRENLLDPLFSDVGFGVAQMSNYSAAGGGPMTIVVAYYGRPASGEPIITSVKGDNSSTNVSVAQLATAKLPIAGLATNLAILAATVALFLWLGRHVRVFRKAVASGERFAVTHPFLDVGLIIIAALSYLLTRTAGLIH